MRIALIAPPWVPVPPRYYGGTETVIDMLARGYVAAGHDVVLFTTGDAGCPVPTRWVYEVAPSTRIGQTEPELRQVLHAYDAVRAEGFDVVHDHTLAGPLLSNPGTDPPVVTTVHNPFDDERSDIYRRLAHRVHVVAISEAQRRVAPDVRVAKVVHHGIDADSLPFAPRGGDSCLFLGRMAPDKGAHLAIAACEKAGVPLRLAGKMRSVEEQAYFDNEVRPHLSDTIEYLGEVDHDDKLELLAGARATLFPITWNEPFGMVLLESMACGTPVLAFPHGAVPEVVEDARTGFLCRDERDMAEAITKVDQLDRHDCRAAVEGYFSARRMVDDYLAFFDVVARP